MTQTLTLQLLIATGMTVFTVMVHLIGLGLLMALLRAHGRRFVHHQLLPHAAIILVVVLGLFLLHTDRHLVLCCGVLTVAHLSRFRGSALLLHGHLHDHRVW